MSTSKLVEQADLLVEQPEPEQARGAEPDDHRQEDDGAGELRQRPVRRREQRQQRSRGPSGSA